MRRKAGVYQTTLPPILKVSFGNFSRMDELPPLTASIHDVDALDRLHLPYRSLRFEQRTLLRDRARDVPGEHKALLDAALARHLEALLRLRVLCSVFENVVAARLQRHEIG
jgi:hypothetical protein